MMEISEFAKNITQEHTQVVPISLFVAILCLCLIVGHLLEENRWVNESITAILIGCVSGIIILSITKWKSSHILRFDEELFFIYLLPPIIFNAGFQVKKKQFFHNFLTIMMFGVIGVFISVSIITVALGTIFSSTDTVCTLQILNQDETPLLYSLVFGEGVVNDATSVVLFNAVQKIDVRELNGKAALRIFRDFLYLFSTSTILGVTAGLLTALVLKTLYFGKHSSVREIALMVLMAYLSYILAEVMHTFAMMSFIAETFIFLYVGMDAFDIEKWRMSKLSFVTSLGVYSALILMILLGRAAFVFPLSLLSNYMNSHRSPSISFNHQVVIWWAGLMRGAVSIALAFKQVCFCSLRMVVAISFSCKIGGMWFAESIITWLVKFTYSGVTSDPDSATMITATIIIVLFTTLVFGFLTRPLVKYLLPHPQHATNNSCREPKSPNEDMNLPLLSFDESTATNLLRAKDSLSMLLDRPVYTIHSFWRRFDDTYMRPVFGGPDSNQSQC
ncbi:Sodium/hydrogen exchanger 4 [Citrus sinensis]|uniref:Sodium/hydrogen exchanger 4 n=1 Tax=Citrus sinensis TaxID=2711 RepID=A0ACB8P0W2_CITSI|nr:Sodium/hydrogen exchanger 4 [Citrus sinensis]